MSSKRYTDEFKKEAVKRVTERGYPASEVARRLGVATQKKVTSCRATPGGVDLPPLPNPLPRGERKSVLILNGHFMMPPSLSPHPSPTPSQT